MRALSQVQNVYVNLPQKVVAVQIKDGMTLSPDISRGRDRSGLRSRDHRDRQHDDRADQGEIDAQIMEDAPATLRSARAAGYLSLLTSAGTLVCCTLPALMVAVGAGACSRPR